jgi:hypothetical protein
VSETEGKYSVELFKEGGEGAGQEEIIDRHDNLTVARAIYRGRAKRLTRALYGAGRVRRTQPFSGCLGGCQRALYAPKSPRSRSARQF